MVSKYRQHFIVNRGKKKVFQVTNTMVALIATAVGYFSNVLFISYLTWFNIIQIDSTLADWGSGRSKSSNFTCEDMHPIYLKHMKMLRKIKAKKESSYQHLLAKLFECARLFSLYPFLYYSANWSLASGGEIFDIESDSDDVNEALDQINWDALSEDSD